MKLTRKDKIDALERNNIGLDNLHDDVINKLYKKHIVENEVLKKRNIDETNPKYLILLEFLNKILVNINKQPITSVFEFKNIDRLDIIKEENLRIIEEMEDKICKHYNKKNCGFYRKTNSYVLTILKGMCRELGLETTRLNKNKAKDCVIKTHIMYSIR